MEKQYEYLISKAKTSMSSEKYEEAEVFCIRAIELEPQNFKAYSMAGNICLLQEKLEDAENYFMQAIQCDIDNGERYFDLANCFYGQKKYMRALENYAKAEQLGCNEKVKQNIYYMMGVINQYAMSSGDKAADYKNALLNYEKATNIQSDFLDNCDVLLKKTQMYLELGNLAEAENCAIQLKLLSPTVFKHYHLVFQLQLEQRKIKQAEGVLEESVKYCALSAEDKVEYAFDHALLNCYKAETIPALSKKYYSSAVNDLLDLNRNPNLTNEIRAEIYITISEIYLKQNMLKMAIQYADKIILMHDSSIIEYSERAYYILLESYAANREYGNALKYAKLLKQSSDTFYKQHGYYTEAFCHKQLSKINVTLRKETFDLYMDAIAFYRGCQISKPNDYVAIIYRIKCYTDIGKFSDAEELCDLLPIDTQTELRAYIAKEKGN